MRNEYVRERCDGKKDVNKRQDGLVMTVRWIKVGWLGGCIKISVGN